MTDDTVEVGLRVIDFLSKQPLKGIAVKACRNNDVDCSEPIATATDTEIAGNVDLKVPRGLLGFFEIESTALPVLLYVTRPIFHDRRLEIPATHAAVLEVMASAAGVALDETMGTALLEVLDCESKPMAGVHFSISRESATPFYLVDSVPDVSATVTVYDDVEHTAYGGFFNVPPGFSAFSLSLRADQPKQGSVNAQIRANTLTLLDIAL